MLNNNVDKQYFDLAKSILSSGSWSDNRTGIKSLSLFGAQLRFSLDHYFPILTTKKVFFKGVVHELLWILSGSTNIVYLQENGVRIWDEWAKAENGELGTGTYGGMWRKFPVGGSLHPLSVDQISNVISSLKNNPESRRHIVSAWHPYWAYQCALTPCHILFQFHTRKLDYLERVKYIDQDHLKEFDRPLHEDEVHSLCDEMNIPQRGLSCQLYQRSADYFLGVPFNISSYSLLTCMVAQVVNMIPLEFIHVFGNVHLYENHLDQIKKQLKRQPRELPILSLNKNIENIFEFKYEDIILYNYNPHPGIKGEVAV